METAQLHCIQKNVINPLVKIISTSFNLDIAKYKFKYYSILEFFSIY